MIDTHLHILPGVDDGQETIEESPTPARAFVPGLISPQHITPEISAFTS